MRRSTPFALAFAHAMTACSGDAPDAGAADASSSDVATEVDVADAIAETPEISDAASLSDADATPSPDATTADVVAETIATDADTPCSVSGAPGVCISVTACAALTGHTSTPGLCPGAADIQCCAETPSVSSNPPIPAGYKLMKQSEVTADMTTWAVDILHDPVTYPMFSTTTKVFGALTVLARVEWHPPDFLNSAIHRGVTLYEPV